MLVLSRHKDERIVIPSAGIEIVLVEIRGDKVRLGIEAPAETKVWRSEVWDRIQADGKEERHDHNTR